MHRFRYYYRQSLRSEKHVFEERKFNMEQIIHATDTNFEGQEAMRQFILNRTPFFGNDDEYADRIAIQVLTTFTTPSKESRTPKANASI